MKYIDEFRRSDVARALANELATVVDRPRQIMEVCDARDLNRAEHPYTQGLMSCLPRVDGHMSELPVLTRESAWLELRER